MADTPLACGAGDLSGRRALVTGGGRGVGLAIARRFAAAGARVLITGRDIGRGEAAAAAIGGEGGEARFHPADQGSDADWALAIDEAEASFGGLDILVVNAGVSEMARTAELPLADFQRVCRINLKGAFLGFKHGLAALRRAARPADDGGAMIAVGSIAALIGVADHIHYTAAKSGVDLLVKAAALELGPEGIRVNAIHPGFVRTDMTASFPDDLRRAAPLGRMAEPDEIAEAALFLASPRSSFMTGAAIVVDGGWTAQ